MSSIACRSSGCLRPDIHHLLLCHNYIWVRYNFLNFESLYDPTFIGFILKVYMLQLHLVLPPFRTPWCSEKIFAIVHSPTLFVRLSFYTIPWKLATSHFYYHFDGAFAVMSYVKLIQMHSGRQERQHNGMCRSCASTITSFSIKAVNGSDIPLVKLLCSGLCAFLSVLSLFSKFIFSV